jgi:GTP cyclohydrolase I
MPSGTRSRRGDEQQYCCRARGEKKRDENCITTQVHGNVDTERDWKNSTRLQQIVRSTISRSNAQF